MQAARRMSGQSPWHLKMLRRVPNGKFGKLHRDIADTAAPIRFAIISRVAIQESGNEARLTRRDVDGYL